MPDAFHSTPAHSPYISVDPCFWLPAISCSYTLCRRGLLSSHSPPWDCKMLWNVATCLKQTTLASHQYASAPINQHRERESLPPQRCFDLYETPTWNKIQTTNNSLQSPILQCLSPLQESVEEVFRLAVWRTDNISNRVFLLPSNHSATFRLSAHNLGRFSLGFSRLSLHFDTRNKQKQVNVSQHLAFEQTFWVDIWRFWSTLPLWCCVILSASRHCLLGWTDRCLTLHCVRRNKWKRKTNSALQIYFFTTCGLFSPFSSVSMHQLKIKNPEFGSGQTDTSSSGQHISDSARIQCIANTGWSRFDADALWPWSHFSEWPWNVMGKIIHARCISLHVDSPTPPVHHHISVCPALTQRNRSVLQSDSSASISVSFISRKNAFSGKIKNGYQNKTLKLLTEVVFFSMLQFQAFAERCNGVGMTHSSGYLGSGVFPAVEPTRSKT